MWDCVPNVFTFITEKEHNFQKNESIACTPPYKKEKKNLIYLNSPRYFVIGCFYYLTTSKQK